MSVKPPRILIACSLSVGLIPMATAELRCDCTRVVDSCTAQVEVQGNGILVTSDRKECSRVDYFVEGQPFVTVTVDGEAKEAWLARTEQPDVLIQSCQVCADRSLAPTGSGGTTSAGATAAAGSAVPGDDPGAPIAKFDPVYPAAARARGLQGYVNVRVTVAPSGLVERVDVIEANPKGAFETAAVAAVQRWRYPPRAEDGGPIQRDERVVFALGPGDFSARMPSSVSTRTPAARPLPGYNQCIGEAEHHRIDDRYEVQLENLCEQALIVYNCVEGTRAGSGRWTCGPRGLKGTVLVRPGDERAGRSISVHTGRETKQFSFVERLSLYRAANPRYWLVACDIEDGSCNDAAARWRDAMDQRPVSTNPGLSKLVDARSSY